ncbi:MAG: hypothetical protein J5I59_00295 [Saprospiraceae bacterium]|nr:hypothetical protein [Saprospiraceae bacterium]
MRIKHNRPTNKLAREQVDGFDRIPEVQDAKMNDFNSIQSWTMDDHDCAYT